MNLFSKRLLRTFFTADADDKMQSKLLSGVSSKEYVDTIKELVLRT